MKIEMIKTTIHEDGGCDANYQLTDGFAPSLSEQKESKAPWMKSGGIDTRNLSKSTVVAGRMLVRPRMIEVGSLPAPPDKNPNVVGCSSKI